MKPHSKANLKEKQAMHENEQMAFQADTALAMQSIITII
jgi:hypothetical protein